jgi:hypothetical protein
MTKLWGDEAGRATKTDRILVLGATEAGRRRALAGAGVPVDWSWPPVATRPAAPALVLPAKRRHAEPAGATPPRATPARADRDERRPTVSPG